MKHFIFAYRRHETLDSSIHPLDPSIHLNWKMKPRLVELEGLIFCGLSQIRIGHSSWSLIYAMRKPGLKVTWPRNLVRFRVRVTEYPNIFDRRPWAMARF